MSVRSRQLDARERSIHQQEIHLARISQPGRFARISQPVSFHGEGHIGFGDSSHARNIIQVGIKGSVASGIGVIRDRIRGLEMGVFSRRFINGKFEDKPQFNHPLQRILNNPTFDPETRSINHSAMQIWGMVVSQYISVGEAYLLVLTDGAGIPTWLQIAQPGSIEPVVSGGRITGYRIISASGATDRILRPQDVIRIWEPDTFDVFTARGVMGQQATEINLDSHVTETAQQFYKNNATPQILFETDDPEAPMPTPEQERAENEGMARAFNRRLGNMLGLGKYIKPRWKAKVLDSSIESKAAVEVMKWSSQQVFEGLRVSPVMVGRNTDVNRAAAETTRFTFDQNTAEPITELIAEALTLQLAPRYPQTGDVQLIVKYRPFIARDKDFEIRKDQIDAASLIRSVNEIRSDREPELQVSSWGALPLGGINIVPITGEIADPIDLSQFGLDEPADVEAIPAVPAEGTEEEETPPEERSRSLTSELRRMRAEFEPEREWQRVLDRETRFTPLYQANQLAVFKRQAVITIERYLESQQGRGSRQSEAEVLAKIIFPIDGWQGMFGEALTPVRSAAFVSSATEATQAITGQVFRMTDAAREILRSQNAAHYLFVNQTTQTAVTDVLTTAIADGIGTEETARRLATKLGDDSLVRARRIARTEMTNATQSAQVQGYDQTGVVERKMWNTSLDTDVRDSHTIEGQTVGLEDEFTLSNGASGQVPGSPQFDAGDRANCRCFVTPVFFEEDALEIGARPTANFAPGEQPPAPLPANPLSPN